METLGHLHTAWRLFAAAPLLYLLMGAALAYGSLLSFGILAGPLIGGFLNVGLGHLRTGRTPGFADIASAVRNLGNLLLLSLVFLLSWVGVGVFLPAFLAVLWWAYVPLFLLSLGLATWYMHVPALIVDQGINLRGAMRESRKRVTADGGFFPHLGFLFCVFFVPPALIFWLSRMFALSNALHFVVCPLQFLALASVYHDDFGKGPDGEQPAVNTEPGAFRQPGQD
jgi:hypothetical protein